MRLRIGSRVLVDHRYGPRRRPGLSARLHQELGRDPSYGEMRARYELEAARRRVIGLVGAVIVGAAMCAGLAWILFGRG